MKKAVLDANTERFKINQQFDEVSKDVFDGIKTQKELTDYIRQYPAPEQKRLHKRFARSEKLYRLPEYRWWLDLAEVQSSQARAQIYFNRWYSEDAEGKEALEETLKKVPGIQSKDFRREFHKIKKDLTNK